MQPLAGLIQAAAAALVPALEARRLAGLAAAAGVGMDVHLVWLIPFQFPIAAAELVVQAVVAMQVVVATA